MLGTPGGFDEPDGIGLVAATRKRRAGVPVSPVSPVRDEGLTILKIGGGGSINHLGIAQGLAAHTGPVVVVLGANAVRGDIAASLGTPPRIVTSVSGVASVFSDNQAIDLMLREKVDCVPVIGARGELVGIVTPTDVITTLFRAVSMARLAQPADTQKTRPRDPRASGTAAKPRP